MADIKFFRGERIKYDYNKETGTGKHANAVYFATDTLELLMNGQCYGQSLEWYEEEESEDPSSSDF